MIPKISLTVIPDYNREIVKYSKKVPKIREIHVTLIDPTKLVSNFIVFFGGFVFYTLDIRIASRLNDRDL